MADMFVSALYGCLPALLPIDLSWLYGAEVEFLKGGVRFAVEDVEQRAFQPELVTGRQQAEGLAGKKPVEAFSHRDHHFVGSSFSRRT